jgi:hypothetical protein
VHLGRLDEAHGTLQALVKSEHESLWMDYLMLRFNLLVNAQRQRPREWIDRLLAEGERYPEFFLVAAEWAFQNGDPVLEREASALFVAAAPAGFPVSLAQAGAWLDFRTRHPGQETVEREPVVVLPMRTSPVPMVEFSINGAPQVWLIVDTGATHLLLDAEYASDVLKLPPGPRIGSVATSTGRVDMMSVHVAAVTAPGLALGNLYTATSNWSELFARAL